LRQVIKRHTAFMEVTSARHSVRTHIGVLATAWFDWASHLMRAPSRQLELSLTAWTNLARLARYTARSTAGARAEAPFRPRDADNRFSAPEWQERPFDIYVQWFLALEDFWGHATKQIRGMSPIHADRLAFMSRQALDVLSPSNNPFLNPVILAPFARSMQAYQAWQTAWAKAIGVRFRTPAA
jgi:polyhydroxyalkanoate synthase